MYGCVRVCVCVWESACVYGCVRVCVRECMCTHELTLTRGEELLLQDGDMAVPLAVDPELHPSGVSYRRVTQRCGA